MEIKDILKNRRLERNMSLKDVADKVGVTISTISRWESGDISNMRRDRIVSYARALDISPSLIMGWEEPPSNKERDYFELSPQELTLIKKYRQLDADGKADISDLIDSKLARAERAAKEQEEGLG
ncbi:MAG: helix-turn-helix domain-containing protein [Phascolarctobacterium sp.]